MACPISDAPTATRQPAGGTNGSRSLSTFHFPRCRRSFVTMSHVSRYVPASTNDGWPFVGVVVLLAATCIVLVTVIHNRTYKHPTDPTWHSGSTTKAAEH